MYESLCLYAWMPITSSVCTCVDIIHDNLFPCGGVVEDIVDPPCFGEDASKAQGVAQREQPKTNLVRNVCKTDNEHWKQKSDWSHIAKSCLSLVCEQVGIKINPHVKHCSPSNEEVVEIWARQLDNPVEPGNSWTKQKDTDVQSLPSVSEYNVEKQTTSSED